MNVGSLCTGYGGLDLAVEAVLGTTLAWVSDIDRDACKVIDARLPGVPNLSDLTAVDWTQVEPVDVLTAGYPCQPFSHAGQRKGTDDARHLWPHIAEAVRVLRPRLVVLENVAGHLTLGFRDVLGDLAALGFDAEWCVVRASDVGACHRRARLFVVAADTDDHGDAQRGRAHRGVGSPPRTGAGGDGQRERLRDASRDPGADAADTQGDAGWLIGENADEAEDLGRERQREAGRREGGPANGGLAATHADGGRRGIVTNDAAGEPDPQGHGGGDEAQRRAQAWGDFAAAIRRHEHVLGRAAPSPVDERGRLSPRFVEWMMMLDAGWVTDVAGLSRSARLRILGNGVVPPQSEHALRLLLSRLAEQVAA